MYCIVYVQKTKKGVFSLFMFLQWIIQNTIFAITHRNMHVAYVMHQCIVYFSLIRNAYMWVEFARREISSIRRFVVCKNGIYVNVNVHDTGATSKQTWWLRLLFGWTSYSFFSLFINCLIVYIVFSVRFS